jgi:hypothetical protein
MDFEHNVITGRFLCPWCEREYMPTKRAALRRSEDDVLIGVGDEYEHLCADARFASPFVISPFPDQFEGLLQRMLEVFPPVEEAA